MNILQWEKGGKLWGGRLTWWEREKGEHKLEVKNEKWKWEVLTNEDQASLNSQKENIKQYQSGDKTLFAFWPTVVNS